MWRHMWEAAVMRAAHLRRPLPQGRVHVSMPGLVREKLRLRQEPEARSLR